MQEPRVKQCKDCGQEKPETRKYFGQYKNKTKNGVTIGFRNSCRECMAETTKKHSANNPHLVNARLERRKNLEKKAAGFYTDADIGKIRRELFDCCRFCEKKLFGKGEIEHLTPISRGGSNYPANITLACLSCNREKTNKTLDEYMAWREERGLPIRIVSMLNENPDFPLREKDQI